MRRYAASERDSPGLRSVWVPITYAGQRHNTKDWFAPQVATPEGCGWTEESRPDQACAHKRDPGTQKHRSSPLYVI